MAADNTHKPPDDASVVASPEITTDRDEGTPGTDPAAAPPAQDGLPVDHLRLHDAPTPTPDQVSGPAPQRDEETALPAKPVEAQVESRTEGDDAFRVELGSRADLPDSVRARLNPGELEAMTWPVIYENGPAPTDETFVAYNRFDWNTGGTPDAGNPRETTTLDAEARPLRWASPLQAASHDQVIDAVHDIRVGDTTLSVGDVLHPPTLGPGGSAGVDVRETRALKPEYDTGTTREEARNGRFTLQIPAGTHREIIYSTTAPQDSQIDQRVGTDAFSGGAPQVLLLDYDQAGSSLSVSPVGEMRELDPGGASRDRYRYPDRLTPEPDPA